MVYYVPISFGKKSVSKIFSVRVIHGKGKGILKKRVHELLKKNPMVKSFKEAPLEAGSWGATLVELKQL
jgi:dsDNA-specific endonuclease/ATPase MutS2